MIYFGNGKGLKMKHQENELIKRDISHEEWREYDFGGRIYRIESPQTVYFRQGGETNRVVDVNGVAHCVPFPGVRACVLRWKNKDGEPEVVF